MSHQAIAAALACADLSVGERLVAFSLASFADRDNLARPGTTVAAVRAGLGKSGFREAQEGLVRRGLVVVVQRATGRGRASLLALPFAEAGERAVRTGPFSRRRVRICRGFRVKKGVRPGPFRPETVRSCQGFRSQKGDRTGPFLAKTRQKTPRKTRRPARAREKKPRTLEPAPQPPEGGSGADQLIVEETYVSERGRSRRRRVTVDLEAVRAELVALRPADRRAWEQIRALLFEAVGGSTFEIWLAQLELIAVDRDGRLVVGTPEATRGWVCRRFGGLLERCADRAGRGIRFADEREQAAVRRPAAAPLAAADEDHDQVPPDAGSASACQSSYTHVYNQQKEVS